MSAMILKQLARHQELFAQEEQATQPLSLQSWFELQQTSRDLADGYLAFARPGANWQPACTTVTSAQPVAPLRNLVQRGGRPVAARNARPSSMFSAFAACISLR